MEQEFKKRQIYDFFRDFTSFGNIWFYLIAVLFFMIFGNKAIANKLLIGLVLIYLIVVIIRTFYFKERPDRYPYKSYIEKLDASSFPSLHSARIAFLSMVLIKHFNNVFLMILMIILAVVVAYSRIELKKHDLKDVLGGIVVGVVVYIIVILNF